MISGPTGEVDSPRQIGDGWRPGPPLMLILNVADIHFRHPECNTPMDPDRPYRTLLVRDARERVAVLGPANVILVGGDIAYHGLVEEYDSALRWLSELADAAGCTLSDVFVVPGNHDVDRGVIKNRADVRNAQRAVSSARPERRERELWEQFRDAKAGPSLLAPVDAYNQFAARFNCQVYAPDKLFWHQDRPLTDSVRIRFYGLTSTLLSGAGASRNEDDSRLSLYLSPFQTGLDPVEGVVNAVICHHPPDWFMDQDDVDDAIRGRAELHFFGHKHRQRIHRDANYVRFSAGAVNPDRNEPGWEPGYNLIKLSVNDDGKSLWLDVEAHLLTWQTNPDGFHPKNDGRGALVFGHRLTLRRATVRDPRTPAGSPVAPSDPKPPTARGTEGNADGEVAMSEPHTRNLVLSFWNLASSQRREIAQRLKLITDEEMKLPEPERYGRALIRASERGLLAQVAAEVERLEKKA